MVKGYIQNVKIKDTTITEMMNSAASDVEAAFSMNGTEFSDTYVYINSIKKLVAKKAACELHLMFGKKEDAKLYCDGYEKDLEKLMVEDTTLDNANLGGAMQPVLPETYPSNPFGSRLEGRTPSLAKRRDFLPEGVMS
jgi:hypothetical protein